MEQKISNKCVHCHGIRSGWRPQFLEYKYRCGWIGHHRQVEEIHHCPDSFLDYFCSYHQGETITNLWYRWLSSCFGVWSWAERSWKLLTLFFNFSSITFHIRKVLFLRSNILKCLILNINKTKDTNLYFYFTINDP